ncbi:MAG TPA: apolipoprotein N-acyltransferase [Micromonosporaceae bacterium]
MPVSVGLALLCGGLLLVAFPPYGLWWLAPLGVASLAVAVHRRGVGFGAVLGALAGLALFVPLLRWTGMHVGAVPWLLLAGLQAGYVALLGAAGAWVSTLADRWKATWPLLVGVLWVGQEALRDRTPFGGFPWGRLAFSQAGGPLLPVARLGGAPLVTFVVAFAGGALAAAVWALLDRRRLLAAGWVGAALVPVLAGLVVPLPAPGGPAVTVAVVQGSVPRLGLDFNAQRRAVLDNHVEATLRLARQVAAGTVARPDLVVWPENSSDIDPLVNGDAWDRIDEAARAVGVPILVGSVLEGPGDHVRNAALVWQPGSGPAEVYVKQHPVPFAEYVPLRRVARMVSDKVDLVPHDFVAGHRPGVVHVGPVTVGDAICFEVAYDDLVRSSVTGGGQLLVVQTNNATFNPAEARQQLAMVRLRAVEHGRDALMASTVGVSGFVDTTGRVWQATGFDTGTVIVRTVHLGDARTLATRLGEVPEFALTTVAVAALVGAGVVRRRYKVARQREREEVK